jgi:hypothetical protein
MVKFLPIPVILLICTSCHRYQYTTISSSNIERNEKNEFVAENDSLKLVYNFSGHQGPINITVENKLSVPVYIDWQRSDIIVNGKAVSFAPGEMKINGEFNGSSYNIGRSNYGVTSGQINATASLPPTMGFIPPKALLNKLPMCLTLRYNESLEDTAWHKMKYTPVEGVTVAVKKATFTEANSPFRFRSYITYMVGEPGSKPLTYEHSFYVSEIMCTGTGPEYMLMNTANRGNQYYTSKMTKGGQVGTVVGLGAILGGVLYLEAKTNNSNGN